MSERTLYDIQSDKRDVLVKLNRMTDELAGLKSRAEQGDEGAAERSANLKVAIDRGSERLAELTLEERDFVLSCAKSGGAGLESGFGGASDGDGGRVKASGIVDQARRRVDALVKAGRLPDHGATATERLLTQAKAADQGIAARWTLVTGSDAYLSAFCKLLADPERGHLLWDGAEQKAWRDVAELKAMSLSDAAGGFLVPFTLDPTILLASAGSTNPLRQIARVVQTVTDSWNGVSSDGVVAEWLAEATEAADASPATAQPSIPVHKGSAFVPYSYEVGMDAVNFGGQLGELLADAADQLQAAAYMNGTGTGQPTGVTTALPAGSRVAAATADTLVAADLVKLQNALPPRFQPRARWLASLATINAAGSLETTNGALRFPEIGSGQLLRKPLHEASMLDAAGDTAAAGNDHVAVYGDFSHFVIADRIGTTIELIPNLTGPNGRPTGQRGVFMWFRTGSDVVVDNAFRMLTA